MHRSLVPELRGAQRFLRSCLCPISPACRQRPQQRYDHGFACYNRPGRAVTVRSFSSYRRLQEKSPDVPVNDDGRKSDNEAAPSSNPSQGLAGLWQQMIQRTAGDGSTRVGNDEPAGTTATRKSSPWEIMAELRDGRLPAGYYVARTSTDLPKDMTDRNYRSDEFPVCYSLDKSNPNPVLPLPKDFPVQDHEKDRSTTQDQNQSFTDLFNNQIQSPTLHIGSDGKITIGQDGSDDLRTFADRRRRRAQQQRNNMKQDEQKSTLPSPLDSSRAGQATTQFPMIEQHSRALSLPDWFVSNNIKQHKSHSQPSPATDASSADGGAAELQIRSQENLQIPPLKQAYSAPPSGPAPSSDPKTFPAGQPLTPQYSTANTISLANGRYFIDAAQYKEVLNTLKGRLCRISNSKARELHHLTVLHTAKNADLLLDALVEDLSAAVGGDRVRVGPQDLAVMLSMAETSPRAAQKMSKLGYSIYSKRYSPFNQLQESNEREEDEDEEDEDEDDEGPGFNPNSMPSFKVRSVVAVPISQAFGHGPSSLGDRLGKMLDAVPNDAYDPKQFHNMAAANTFSNVEKLAEIIIEKGLSTTQDGASPSDDHPRPLIVHIPAYPALHDHSAAAAAFLRAVVNAAETQSTSSRPIIVVGTDVLHNLDFLQDQANKVREEPSPMLARMFNLQPPSEQNSASSPRAILDQQESLSFGDSSTIVLTTVFPTPEAGNALTKDRDTIIRDINVRHLYQALRSRDITLAGLEDDFWSSDYTEALGEQDCAVSSQGFWPYLHVQRLAAVLAGLVPMPRSPISEATSIIIQSDESKVAWAKHFQTNRAKDGIQPESKLLSSVRAKANQHEKKLMAGVIEPKKITTTFSDIHIPTDTVDTLQMLTSLSLIRPEAFKYGVLKSDRIPGLLLYGPPGTGKTLAAKAVAKESGATMLEVSGADLNDMYVGEGEKNVKALFSLAKKLSPCVVFIDEADAMFSTRSSGARKTGHRELLNQFLKEWDGMSNDSGSAFIMVATNRPMDLDDAVLRRLPRRLLVDLPTEADRHEILNIHLRNEQVDAQVDLKDLAKKTPFYSGSDLKNLAVAAALQAVREENEAAKKWRLENADAESAYTYPEKRILTQAHFDKALQEISASISEDMSSLRAIKKFDEQYGDRKGRKRRGSKWGFKSASDADKIIDTVKVRS